MIIISALMKVIRRFAMEKMKTAIPIVQYVDTDYL
jgi:hypothetical protein